MISNVDAYGTCFPRTIRFLPIAPNGTLIDEFLPMGPPSGFHVVQNIRSNSQVCCPNLRMHMFFDTVLRIQPILP